MTSIIVADSHKLFRETLSLMLGRQAGMNVIATCAENMDGMLLIQTLQPDIILMNMNLKPTPGIEIIESLRLTPYAKIIALSIHSDPSYAEKMIKAGAIGYVTKNSSIEEICMAIQEAANGRQYICHETAIDMPAENSIQTIGPAVVTQQQEKKGRFSIFKYRHFLQHFNYPGKAHVEIH